MFPLTFTQLARLTDAELNTQARCDSATISSISTDTRSLRRGDLFVALKGTQFDGHDFLDEAVARGAIGTVVSVNNKSCQTVGDQAASVAVDDPLQALQQLAQWNASQSDSLKIGVTGSVGKTTTRHMIHTVLSGQYRGIQSPGNYNNQIGVPLSLLCLSEEDEFGVIEFGASSPGEISNLAGWTEPEIGVLTNIGPAHLDGFGSVETVIQSKAELIDAVGANGLMFLPVEMACIPEIKRRLPARTITIGQADGSDILAEDVSFRQGVLQFSVAGEVYHLTVPGRHFLNSALIALGIARELGIPGRQIQQAFNQFKPLSGRCQLRQLGNWRVLDDCYNASPLSVAAGLDAIAELDGVSDRIAVLGDMLGLGKLSTYYHRKLGMQAAKSNLDFLVIYGEFAHDVAHGAIRAGMNGSRIGVFEDLDLLKEILELWMEQKCGLLIKGSRNMHMERVFAWLEERAHSQGQARQDAESNLIYRRAG